MLRKTWMVLFGFVTATVVSGCGAEDPTTGDEQDVTESTGAVQPGSAEAFGVLQLANEASLVTLDGDVGLNKTAAENIVARRDGADGLAGTSDDAPFDTIAALDAVAYVGTVALQKLSTYASSQGYVGPKGKHGLFDAAAFAAADPITAAEIKKHIPAGGSESGVVGTFHITQRVRDCNAQTGCGDYRYPEDVTVKYNTYSFVSCGFAKPCRSCNALFDKKYTSIEGTVRFRTTATSFLGLLASDVTGGVTCTDVTGDAPSCSTFHTKDSLLDDMPHMTCLNQGIVGRGEDSDVYPSNLAALSPSKDVRVNVPLSFTAKHVYGKFTRIGTPAGDGSYQIVEYVVYAPL